MNNIITRPTWVEINLDNLKNNIEEVRRVTGKRKIITAVVKADAYGHGALGVIDTLLNNGADRLAVATINEALEIRKKYKDVEIMILGYTPDEFIEDIINNNIIQTIYNVEQAEVFNHFAEKLDVKVKVHIKVDTGMRRLGFDWENIDDIASLFDLENIIYEGIFTHFAVADEEDKSYTIKQYNRFNQVVKELEQREIKIPIKHVSNSAAIIDLPEFSYDMVRAGIMLYGLYPSNEVGRDHVSLKPVMTFKTRIAYVKNVEKNEGISYGLIYKTDKKKKIATLPVGYADGYSRMLTGKTEVLVGPNRKKVVGKICMDQMMIDLGNAKSQVGDEVILFGGNKKNVLPIEEIANLLGTINYEIVCMISRRVPRVYLENGQIVNVVDNLY
ncbi:MAG: alanine racemase [Bacillota bacterium]|nr:alanine racemase [Bacillota bacterium]